MATYTHTYTNRVKALILVAEHTDDKVLINKARELRKSSDVAEIIGHPRNPNFFPETLPEGDASVKLLQQFKKEYRETEGKILELFQKKHGIEHIRSLAFIISRGEHEKVTEYLKESFPQVAVQP